MNRRDFCLSIAGGIVGLGAASFLSSREARAETLPNFVAKIMPPTPMERSDCFPWEKRFAGFPDPRAATHGPYPDSYIILGSGMVSSYLETSARTMRRAGMGFFVPVSVEQSFLACSERGCLKSVPLFRNGNAFTQNNCEKTKNAHGFLVAESFERGCVSTKSVVSARRWIVLNDLRRCRWEVFLDLSSTRMFGAYGPTAGALRTDRLKLEMSKFVDDLYSGACT